MRKHGGSPFGRDKHVTLAAISPPGVAGAALLGTTSQVYRDVSRPPSSCAEPLPVRHRGNTRRYNRAPLHNRVHLPTYLPPPLCCAATTCFHTGNPWTPEYCATCFACGRMETGRGTGIPRDAGCEARWGIY